MRNLLLFEAFATDRLNKTMAFINKDDQERFRKDIKLVGDIYDFPVSDFNDDTFQYLTYQKALKLFNKSEGGICKKESYIKGEFCEDGKIKRTWGKSKKTGNPLIRTLTCPDCKGTGRESGREIGYIKFWFSKDGHYNGMTLTDSTKVIDENKFSKELSDYYVVKEFKTNGDKRRELNTGDIISVNLFSSSPNRNNKEYQNPIGDKVAVVKKQNTSIFAIQDYVDSGATTWSWNANWKTHGRFAYNITQVNSHTGNVKLLRSKESAIDPLSWNYAFSRVDNDSFYKKRPIDRDNILKDSHFSLVLDVRKLKEVKHLSLSKTKKDRKDSKKGALGLMKNKEIRNANLQRYFDKIKDSFEIDMSDISNLNLLFRRIIGFNRSWWVKIYRDESYSYINSISLQIYDSMYNDGLSKAQVESLKTAISKSLKDVYARTNTYIQLSNTELEKVKGTPRVSEKTLEIVNAFDELSRETNLALREIKIESLADVYNFQLKAKTMMIPKFPSLKQAYNVFRYMVMYGGVRIDGDLQNINIEKFRQDVEMQIEYIRKV